MKLFKHQVTTAKVRERGMRVRRCLGGQNTGSEVGVGGVRGARGVCCGIYCRRRQYMPTFRAHIVGSRQSKNKQNTHLRDDDDDIMMIIIFIESY